VISRKIINLPDNVIHSQQTDNHAADEIRTQIPSKGAVTDPRLKPRGLWARNVSLYFTKLGILFGWEEIFFGRKTRRVNTQETSEALYGSVRLEGNCQLEMTATEEAMVYLELQYLHAPNGIQRKTRIGVPWILGRDSNKEPSYFTDQAVKVCICIRDAHISHQKAIFVFPSFFRQMEGFCLEEVYGTVIPCEGFRTHQ
jgi:hypothetical protein